MEQAEQKELNVQLTRCPFCNQDSSLHTFNDGDKVYVKCFSCGATGPDASFEQQAIIWWNHRQACFDCVGGRPGDTE